MSYNNISPQKLFKLCLGMAAFGVVLLISSIGLFVFQLTTSNPKKAEAGTLEATSYREFWCGNTIYGPGDVNLYTRYSIDCNSKFLGAADPYTIPADPTTEQKKSLAEHWIGDYRTLGIDTGSETSSSSRLNIIRSLDAGFINNIQKQQTSIDGTGNNYQESQRKYLSAYTNTNAPAIVTSWSVFGSIGGKGDTNVPPAADIDPYHFGK